MPTVNLPARVHVATVTEHRELARDVVLLAFDAPALVEATRPGQYVMAVPPSGEAAAVALGIYEAEGKRVSLLFFVIGKRTRELAGCGPATASTGWAARQRLRPIDRRRRRRDRRGRRRHRLGLALRASTRAPRQAPPALLWGAQRQTARRRRSFRRAGCELVLATDDGTRGERGFITAAARARSSARAHLCLRPVADVAQRRAHRE